MSGIHLVEDRARIIAADRVVIEQNVSCGDAFPVGEGTLQDEGIVCEGIEDRVTHRHILAGIDVDCIPIRIDNNSADGPVIHSSAQNREVPAIPDMKVAKDNVPGVLQADSFISRPRNSRRGSQLDLARIEAGQHIHRHPVAVTVTAVNKSGPGNHYILNADAVEETVGDVRVPHILQAVKEVYFRGIVETTILVFAGTLNGRPEDGIPGSKVEADVTLEADRIGLECSCRNDDGMTTVPPPAFAAASIAALI